MVARVGVSYLRLSERSYRLADDISSCRQITEHAIKYDGLLGTAFKVMANGEPFEGYIKRLSLRYLSGRNWRKYYMEIVCKWWFLL